MKIVRKKFGTTNFKLTIVVFLLLLSSFANSGPYPPPVGQDGSTAISKDDPDFVEWATGITIQRGLVKINEPGVYVSYGNDANALGKAQGGAHEAVSLGDGGIATLTFDHPITNGPGFDFAVFENSLNDTFLELAFVEVSSDGSNFFRFDAVSLTPTNVQINGFLNTLDATNLNNLAGKYRAGYGTPFDLEELKGVSPLLDVTSIRYVRIIDVVGFVEPADVYGDGIVDFHDYSIFAAAYMSKTADQGWNENCDIFLPSPKDDVPNGVIDMLDFQEFMSKWLKENNYSSCDSQGHQIRDPWPTPFYTGGFDLDAVGVIHQKNG